jgi:hypothetical protein
METQKMKSKPKRRKPPRRQRPAMCAACGRPRKTVKDAGMEFTNIGEFLPYCIDCINQAAKAERTNT